MATATYSEFLPHLLPWAVGCPDPTAINAVRNAAIEFCTRTKIWQETQDAETIAVGALPFELSGPSGANVVQVLSCKVDGQALDAVTIDYLDASVSRWEDQSGTPSNFFQPSLLELNFFPQPTAAISLRLRVAYAPSRSSTTLDRAVFENYAPTITAGALSALLLIPEVPFGNPKLASFHQANFEGGVLAAQQVVSRSFTRSPSRTRPNPF